MRIFVAGSPIIQNESYLTLAYVANEGRGNWVLIAGVEFD